MSKLHDFLVEHAKFPFPALNEYLSSSTTDISTLKVDSLEKKNPEWKAKLAVRDDTLVQKLCDALEGILGDVPLAESAEDYLLASSSPRIQFDERDREDKDWSMNSREVDSRGLLDKGFFLAARKFFWACDRSIFNTTREHLVEVYKVDYVALVNNKITGLFMKNVCNSLPPHGIELKWVHGQPLVPKILAKAALYMGLRKTEWLFLTCFNYWIVCRLVRDDHHPYLVYSPGISIQESSEPFRAFLGAILSVVKDVPVESSAYNPNIKLDSIEEEQDDIDDVTFLGRHLQVTSSSPKLSEDLQVWTRLYTTSNNSVAIPPCARNDKPMVLRPSDTQKRQRLRNKFKIYLNLDDAYQSGRLHDRSAYMDVLILDLCDSIMNSWDDLSASEQSKVYKLVQDLHRIGIAHEDLEPRNIVRTHGGKFLLIDFSKSRKHVCKESKKCYELQTLRNLLWKRQPLQAKGVSFG
ncbi:hypothetical protein BGW80DRAFT_1434619 [Lactifluus volemus]|nr:hypothetical protein BGW80DRAFT_1434619 [Lactifluus volemus]